jgi:glutamine amidotransferase
VIAIINYGSGNIQAIANIYSRLGLPFLVASTPDELALADHYLLPGVGAFDQCMRALNDSGMRPGLDAAVRLARKPVLGICVGMQMLADSSDEGDEPGLGWIPGRVRRFDPALLQAKTRLPHMGWNTVTPAQDSRLFERVDLAIGYYFLHSYYFSCAREADVLAVTDYAGPFACAVHHDNVYGVQFHPEKSHQAGVLLLENFTRL